MKYLKIHIAIWYLFHAIILLFDMLIFGIAFIFYFIWSFKFLKWERLHYIDVWTDNNWDGTTYKDVTPIDTFKRHINCFNQLTDE
jgi:hypothetical protein